MPPLKWGLLADDIVRFVGEPIAAVVASSVAAAQDALELIEVDYAPLPALVDPFVALEADAQQSDATLLLIGAHDGIISGAGPATGTRPAESARVKQARAATGGGNGAHAHDHAGHSH